MRYTSKLLGHLQRYPWGRGARDSRIASFRQFRGSEGPFAEYWLGGHPKGPARLLSGGSGGDVSLVSALQSDPRGLLGSSWRSGTEPALPFMLKVLSINEECGLSIQLHPTKALAEELHAKDPQNYPDDNHKPELGVALAETSILYGFKSVAELKQVLVRFPELAGVLGEGGVQRIQEAASASVADEVVRDVVAHLYGASAESTATVVRHIAQRLSSMSQLVPEEEALMRLRRIHGDGDVGLLMLCVMNLVTLQPGEGIFIGPCIPHAYLSGELVECMACSDNVVRAGLTTKFRDDATLLGCTAYAAGRPTVLHPAADSEGVLEYPTPCREFHLRVAPLGSTPLRIQGAVTPGIMLVLGERATVRSTRDASLCFELSDGEALFIPPREESFVLERQNSAVYHAVAGIAE